MRVVRLDYDLGPDARQVARVWVGPGGRELAAVLADGGCPAGVVWYDLAADRPGDQMPASGVPGGAGPPPAVSGDLNLLAVAAADENTAPEFVLLSDRRPGGSKNVALGTDAEDANRVTALALTPDGTTLIAAGFDAGSEAPAVWRWNTAKALTPPKGAAPAEGYVGGGALPELEWPTPERSEDDDEGRVLAVSPDGTRFAVGTSNRRVIVWQTKGKRHPVAELLCWPAAGRRGDGPDPAVRAVAFGPRGKTLAAAVGDAVHWFDVAAGQAAWVWRNPGGPVAGLAVSPAGGRVAVVGGGPAVHLLDPAAGAARQTFGWEVGPLGSVAFAPDGLTAAAGGDGGRVVVWDLGG